VVIDGVYPFIIKGSLLIGLSAATPQLVFLESSTSFVTPLLLILRYVV